MHEPSTHAHAAHPHDGPEPGVLDPVPLELVDTARATTGSQDGADGWARVFDVLSDPNRLRLLVAIHHDGAVYVKDLADRTGMSGTAVSHALRLLRNTGIVTAQRDGQRVYYTLADPLVHELLHRLTGTDPHPFTTPR